MEQSKRYFTACMINIFAAILWFYVGSFAAFALMETSLFYISLVMATIYVFVALILALLAHQSFMRYLDAQDDEWNGWWRRRQDEDDPVIPPPAPQPPGLKIPDLEFDWLMDQATTINKRELVGSRD